MTESDKAALELAMMRACELEPRWGEQLNSKLVEEGWEETARFAAVCCQSRILHLRPWEISPAQIDDPYDRVDLFLHDPFGYAHQLPRSRFLRLRDLGEDVVALSRQSFRRLGDIALGQGQSYAVDQAVVQIK
jgi:hypothetical protein